MLFHLYIWLIRLTSYGSRMPVMHVAYSGGRICSGRVWTCVMYVRNWCHLFRVGHFVPCSAFACNTGFGERLGTEVGAQIIVVIIFGEDTTCAVYCVISQLVKCASGCPIM